MMRAFLTVWPFDLLDADFSHRLDRWHGDIGLTGLAVWMAGGPSIALRLDGAEPRLFRSRGGLFFPPDKDRYGDSRLKPLVSDWSRSRNDLARIAEECARRGMELRCVAAASSIGRMAQRHPATAVKSAFGDDSAVSLCLLNPDVEAFLLALVDDLSAREHVNGLVISDFENAWREAFDPRLAAAPPLSGVQRQLLSLCFCESCRQRASRENRDGDMAARSVRQWIDRLSHLADEQPPSVQEIIDADSPLSLWIQWQRKELSSLAGRVMEQCRRELVFMPDPAADPVTVTLGTDPPAPVRVMKLLHDEESLLGSHSPKELLVSLRESTPDRHQRMISLVTRAAERGASVVTFEGAVIPTEPALVAIRQALRYARRTVGVP